MKYRPACRLGTVARSCTSSTVVAECRKPRAKRAKLLNVSTLFDVLAEASERVAEASKRNDKVSVLAGALRRLGPAEMESSVAYLTGTTPLGRIGVGWSTLSGARAEPTDEPTLTIAEVDDAISELAQMEGPGVLAARRHRLVNVLERSNEREQRLLVAVLSGELRQGALDGVMVSAIAKAADVPVAAVRRAAMMTGDLGEAARVAMTGGVGDLDAIEMTPLRPVLPMLASPATDVVDALDGIGNASIEWKLDGARIQAHRREGVVRLFTRNLHDVTDRLSGVAQAVLALPGGDLVLDGEVMGIDTDGAPGRFQDTMGNFSAEGSVGRGADLRAFFFDILHAEGSAVHDEPLLIRRELLRSVVPTESRLPSIVTADASQAQDFLDSALKAGHEGVMVKALDQTYMAGRRGRAWRKVKPVYTLDLVVLAVEWGHGRRAGWLSNIHLGARAANAAGEFVMVGKTFKGMTDELLRWQTERFLELEIGRDGHTVHVRPEQVVEVAVDGVQVSTKYPGGVALRFARVRRYRDDKVTPDTIDSLRALL
jgi:DNA ligase-1